MDKVNLEEGRGGAENITQDYDALLKIDPKLKYYCQGNKQKNAQSSVSTMNLSPDQTDTEVKESCIGDEQENAQDPVSPTNLSPAQTSQEISSAVESAKHPLKSSSQMKRRTAIYVDHAHDCFSEAHKAWYSVHTTLADATSSSTLAAEELVNVQTYLSNMKSKGLSNMSDYAANQVAMAKELAKSTTESAEMAKRPCDEAVKIRDDAKKELDAATADYIFSSKEMHDPHSVLEKLIQKKRGIDVDATLPAQKKQRTNE